MRKDDKLELVGHGMKTAGDIIREVSLGSRIDGLAAPAAKPRACWITGAANPADHFDWSRRSPVKRSNADWNPALSAESRSRRIPETATRTRHSGDGLRQWRAGARHARLRRTLDHGLKGCVATAAAESGSGRKSRLTSRAHDNAGHARLSAGATVQAAAL